MTLKANFKKHILEFKRPSGTSRGILKQKDTYFLCLEKDGKKGIGECGLLRGLSVDDRTDYEVKLEWLCSNIDLSFSELYQELKEFPSIQFGLEQAMLSLEAHNPFVLFESGFVSQNQPIGINGLVWMGDARFMQDQIEEKLKQGFHCIKMKIGAIEFEKEVKLLQEIRSNFNAETIELRVDANGAFSPEEAMKKLDRLAALDLHSIEQPIKAKQWEAMAALCEKTPLPIALDEELIGVFETEKKQQLLDTIKPQYIILKPSLVGGFQGSETWIQLAASRSIGWWITSALESNIGLNAIAQWTAVLDNTMPQGLGTGSLYTNNIDSPLEVSNGGLYYNKQLTWNLNKIKCI